MRGSAGNLGTREIATSPLKGVTGEGQPRDGGPPGPQPCGLPEAAFLRGPPPPAARASSSSLGCADGRRRGLPHPSFLQRAGQTQPPVAGR